MTFLFTDIEGSTRRWDVDDAAMAKALEQHDSIVRDSVGTHDGTIFATGGDGFAIAFGRAADALACAVEVQRALLDAQLPRVRMGVHTGEAIERGGDYFGPTVNRAARIMAVGHGGQVLVSSATRELAGGEFALVSLGEHRLRDLSRPERIHQVCAPGLPTDFPQLRSLDTLPTNLPVELTTFVGRDDDVEALIGLVRAERLVTLTGVGGVGKTRLAVHVAAGMIDDFPDGVWLCELAAADDRDALLQVMASSFGVQRQEADPVVRIIEHLRNRRALIVVDNCEHLLDDVAEVADRIVRSCPSVHLLATSREGLGADGERVRPLRPLVADAAATLFADRAAAAAPDFTLDAETRATVVEICRRLDGIPLAIELAAARVGALRPADIAAHLDERFRLLVGRRGRGVERHQTLHATVDWSYSLLDDSARVVFDRLGVFAGSFDVDAAVAVAGGEDLDRFDVLDALGELVGKSMVVLDDADPTASRYRLLETLRQYAVERLDDDGAADELRRRHAQHYAGFVERVAPHLTARDELVWRPRVRAELDNVRAAVGWSLDRDDEHDAELAARIIAALVFEVVGFRSSGIGQWAERAAATDAIARSTRRAAVFIAAGYGAFHRLDVDAAQRWADAAVEASTIDEPGLYALSRALSANVTISPDGLARCASIALDALAALDGTDAGWGRFALVPAPLFLVLVGEEERGRQLADAMLADARVLGWPTGIAMTTYAVAFTNQFSDHARALAAADESIALTEAGASDVVYGHSFIVRGVVNSRLGRLTDAGRDLARAIRYSDSIGDRIEVISAIGFAVNALVDAGRHEVAATIGSGWSGLRTPLQPATDLENEFDRALAMSRAALGDESYLEAAARGTRMSYDDALQMTLRALDALAEGAP